MIIETKGRHDFIDGHEYKRAYIRVSVPCKIIMREGSIIKETLWIEKLLKFISKSYRYSQENIRELNQDQYIEVDGKKCKNFTVIPNDKTVKYTIKITDK